MNRWMQTFPRQPRKCMPRKQRVRMQLEVLEDRKLLSPVQHTLLLSVDGLHQADIADPNLQAYLTNILHLQSNGVTYTQAHTPNPSDSFDGTIAYLSGASPAATGICYEDSYASALAGPGRRLHTRHRDPVRRSPGHQPHPAQRRRQFRRHQP